MGWRKYQRYRAGHRKSPVQNGKFIPTGHGHTLEKPGKVLLELLEIQSDFCSEDDLILIQEIFADRTGRV